MTACEGAATGRSRASSGVRCEDDGAGGGVSASVTEAMAESVAHAGLLAAIPAGRVHANATTTTEAATTRETATSIARRLPRRNGSPSPLRDPWAFPCLHPPPRLPRSFRSRWAAGSRVRCRSSPVGWPHALPSWRRAATEESSSVVPSRPPARKRIPAPARALRSGPAPRGNEGRDQGRRFGETSDRTRGRTSAPSPRARGEAGLRFRSISR